VDPSEKVDKYRELFERHYCEALETVNKDPQQVAEKLWGSITALIKLYAVLKGSLLPSGIMVGSSTTSPIMLRRLSRSYSSTYLKLDVSYTSTSTKDT
jgi:hypothetical protein